MVDKIHVFQLNFVVFWNAFEWQQVLTKSQEFYNYDAIDTLFLSFVFLILFLYFSEIKICNEKMQAKALHLLQVVVEKTKTKRTRITWKKKKFIFSIQTFKQYLQETWLGYNFKFSYSCWQFSTLSSSLSLSDFFISLPFPLEQLL